MTAGIAIVTPAQVTQFANSLDDGIKRLRQKGQHMRESVKAARATWKDAKYDAFQKQLSSCMADLDKFNTTGTRYVDFLRDKASLANKYLSRG